MNGRTRRTGIAALAALAVGSGLLAAAGTASATEGDPSSPCDRHQLVAEVHVIDSVLRYYRVELETAPGTAYCEVSGTPQAVTFYQQDGALSGVTATPGNPRADEPVTITPDHPAHVDLRGGDGDMVPTDRVEFLVPGLDGLTYANRAWWPDTVVPDTIVVGLIQPGA